MSLDDPTRGVHARCANGGYDLFGSPHDVCAECGQIHQAIGAGTKKLRSGIVVALIVFSLSAAAEIINSLILQSLDVIAGSARCCPRAGELGLGGLVELGAFGAIVVCHALVRDLPLARRVINDVLVAVVAALITCLVAVAAR